MSIPTEAIEAAMSAADGLGRDGNNSWSDAAIMSAALTAAAPFIAAEAVRAELMEVALMLEPFSGIGLANGATRNDVANWLRARALAIEGKSE